MPFNNYSPTYVFKGAVQADNAPSNSNDLVRKQDVSGLSYISSIAAGSSNYLSVTNGELSVSNLLVTDVKVNTTDSTLSAYITNSASGDNLGTGDIVILTAPSANLMYIVKSGTGSQSSDYEEIQSSLTAAEIVALLSGGTGITVASDGTISIDFTEFDTDSITEGSSNLFYSSSLFDTDFGGKSTSDLSEGSNLYFTNARARSAVSAAVGSDITYNSSTGVFSVTTYKSSDFDTDFGGKSTSDLSEGSNLYYTDARARTAVSGGDGLSYNSSTGEFSADLGDGLLIDLNGAIGLDLGSGLEIDGVDQRLKVNNAYFRKEFTSQSFTANVAKTINHALGQKYVHVSIYDSSDNLIQAEVSLTDANNLTITSNSGLTGVTVVVSI
jgi:hypothetical protein